MSEAILANLREVISQHLPAMSAGEMLKYLESSKRLEAALAEAERLKSDAQKDRDEFRIRVAKLEGQLSVAEKIHGDLSKRELAVEARERNLNLEIAKISVAEAERRCFEMKDLVSLVFRNPRFVRTVEESGSKPVAMNSYGNVEHGSTSNKKTETEETE